MPETFKKDSVCKVNDELGLVFGYAIVCKEDGQDYFDVHGDHIPEDSMLRVSTEFMSGARVAGEMHRKEAGTIIHAFPLTQEIAKALGIEAKRHGLLVAVRPSDPEVLAKARRGEYSGFSIAGTVHEGGREEVE
jgi:hypothetical protein